MPQSKASKKHQYIRKLKYKIRRRERLGMSVEGLKKELAYATGETPRPPFKTGPEAAGVKRYAQSKQK